MTGAFRTLLFHLALALALVAGTGCVAIGASGAVAAGLGGVFGKDFVAGDPPGLTYTPQRCAEFLEYHPEAGECRAAAAAHHFDEVVEYRLAVGVMGLLLLGAVLLGRRWFQRLAPPHVIPESFTPTVGASLFGLATAALLPMSLLQLGFGRPAGAGQLLSAGVVSLGFFAGYAAALLRTLHAHLALVSQAPPRPL